MTRPLSLLVVAFVALATLSSAATFRFETDPFAGSDALTKPGRDVVGGEPFIVFDPANDVFSVEPNVFGITNTVVFANDVVGNLPASGANFIVLRTFDNDANPLTPFNAGAAANLIAQQVTGSGAGFFIYFNQALDLPRLVYSTDLSDANSDLKIIARLTNLGGAPGQAALADFEASNFEIQAVPEPSTSALMSGAALLWASYLGARRKLHRRR